MASEKTVMLGDECILLADVSSIGHAQGTVTIRLRTKDTYSRLYSTEEEAADAAADLQAKWKEFLAYA